MAVSVSPPAPGLRYRHIVKGGAHYYILFNEGETSIEARLDLSVTGNRLLLDPITMERTIQESDTSIYLSPHEWSVIKIATESTATEP